MLISGKMRHSKLVRPVAAVQRAVLNGLGDVRHRDVRVAGQIGDYLLPTIRSRTYAGIVAKPGV